MSNRTNIAVTPVVITKRAGLASADVLVSKYTCCAMPGGSLAELRAVLLEDDTMEVGDKFYFAGTTLGKSAERGMKWENIAENGGVTIVRPDALNMDLQVLVRQSVFTPANQASVGPEGAVRIESTTTTIYGLDNVNGTLESTVPQEHDPNGDLPTPSNARQMSVTRSIRIEPMINLPHARATADSEPGSCLPLDTGVFHTSSLRPHDRPAHQNCTIVQFTVPHLGQSLPRVLLGLNALDFACGRPLRLIATAEQVTNNSARLNLVSWDDTVHYASGCAWLALPPFECEEGRNFQTGRFDTTDDHPWDKPQAATIRSITFAHRYAAPPQVVVWLDRLSTNYHEADVRVRVWADRVSNEGFTLNVDTWDDTKLYTASVTWLAYDAQRTDISSGMYSTHEVRHTHPPKLESSGYVSSARARFASVPRVFMALKSVHFCRGRNLRLRQLSASEVTTTGMTWHIDSWDDTELYSADVSFVAF